HHGHLDVTRRLRLLPARRRARVVSLFFFFQAEDGIRDFHVTGVQTCALPISADTPMALTRAAYHLGNRHVLVEVGADYLKLEYRSEERRVGKECRSRGWRRP